MSKEVTFKENSNKMSERDYLDFLERQKSKGYINDAKMDSNGNVIDLSDFILMGLDIMTEAVER